MSVRTVEYRPLISSRTAGRYLWAAEHKGDTAANAPTDFVDLHITERIRFAKRAAFSFVLDSVILIK